MIRLVGTLALRARRRRELVAALGATLVVGCSSEPAPATVPDAGPPPQPQECKPGERKLDDGTCRTAGIPPEACAAGFEPDSGGGCSAILPDMPCEPGTMAVPGDASCRPVMACGDGRWGDIPVDATTQYVDASATPPGNGTAEAPWTTIDDALAAAEPFAVIAIAAGDYDGPFLLNDPVRLWGRCPDLVRLTTPDVEPVVTVNGSGDGSEVHGVSISAPVGNSVFVRAQNVLLDRIWVHDSPEFGIGADDPSTTLTIVDSLIESVGFVGIIGQGATLTVERSVVRDTKPRPSDGELGRGLQIQHAGTTQGNATIRGSVFERNTQVGVFSNGSILTIEASVVRDTQLSGAGSVESRTGINAQYEPSVSLRPIVTIRTSVVERNNVSGAGADLTLEHVVVRGSTEMGLTDGRGVTIAAYPNAEAPRGNLTLRESLVDDNQGMGVFVLGSDALLQSVLVRETRLLEIDGLETYGQGLFSIFDVDTNHPSSVTLESCRFEENHSTGVISIGSDVVAEDCAVSGTLPQGGNGWYGRGLQAQVEYESGTRGTAFVRRCAFHDNFEAGIAIGGADATIEDTLISSTKAGSIDQELGDGIAVASREGYPATALIERVELVDNARAGVGNFGADVKLGGSRLECNAIDLHADDFFGYEFEMSDEGGNTCGCKGEQIECKILSAGLSPPENAPGSP